MAYRFERYSPEYTTQIAELRSRAFGGDTAFNLDYFAWKYDQNPFLDTPHFYVALHDKTVVGMRGFYGTRWLAGERLEPVLIPIGGDLAVDPDHRRAKLASRLIAHVTADMASMGYPYLMNLSANSASRRLQIRSRYPLVVAYQTLHRPVPRPSLLSRGLRRAKKAVGGNLSAIPFRRFDRWAARAGGPIFAAADPAIADMSELVSKCGNKSRIRLARDEAFYRWRFLDPRCRYRFIYHRTNGQLGGFLVLQSLHTGGRKTIVDWEARTHEVWAALLEAATLSQTNPLSIISTRFSNAQLQCLRGLGFEPTNEPDTVEEPVPGMLLHVSSSGAAEDAPLGDFRAQDAGSWDIRMIASDAF